MAKLDSPNVEFERNGQVVDACCRLSFDRSPRVDRLTTIIEELHLA